MKRIFKRIAKYTFVAIATFLACSIVSLLIVYQIRYQNRREPEQNASIEIPPAAPVKSENPVLLPSPKRIVWNKGKFMLPEHISIQAPADDADALAAICSRLPVTGVAVAKSGMPHIYFKRDDNLGPEGYKLSVAPNRVVLAYRHLRGASYGITTLRQLITKNARTIACVDITDEPDLATRGAMIDISRGKVPKLETLYKLVDLLAELKYNQLQLYVEGFSFGYPSFRQYWESTETPLMPEEIRALDAYCQARYIELVPNQNSLGHMQDWLKQNDLKDLAECPEGYKLLGLIEVKTTLSPTDPRSLELVKKMTDDLLPNFTSKQFNVNLDEPFELGKSKQRPISDHKEIARLYMSYVDQLHDFVKQKGKKMMMWGDVISRTPEIIPQIPHDITLLEWRYEAIQPFDKICQQYQKAGMQYMVCPGTSSWSSFTGRTDNMLANVSNAVESGIKYGAVGMLITDWGDSPHLQYLTVSYAGFVYAGALSWNYASKNSVPLERFLGEKVFQDTTGRMGSLVMNLGRYNQFEEYPMLSMTTTNLALRLGMMDPVMGNAISARMQTGIFELASFDSATVGSLKHMFKSEKSYQSTSLLKYLTVLDDELDKVHLNTTDSTLIIEEYRNAIRMTRASALLKHYNLYHLEASDEQNRATLSEIKSLCSDLLREHEQLWMIRNKRSGLSGSMESLIKLRSDANKQLERLDGNGFSRWTSRQVEKMVAAGVALYLD